MAENKSIHRIHKIKTPEKTFKISQISSQNHIHTTKQYRTCWGESWGKLSSAVITNTINSVKKERWGRDISSMKWREMKLYLRQIERDELEHDGSKYENTVQGEGRNDNL